MCMPLIFFDFIRITLNIYLTFSISCVYLSLYFSINRLLLFPYVDNFIRFNLYSSTMTTGCGLQKK